MEFKRLGMILVLVMTCLATYSCVSSSDTDGDETKTPNFVNDPCSGCKSEEYIGNVTGIRFFSYVKNDGGAGVISMTIGTVDYSATQQFTVTAGTSYIFQASVPVEISSTTSFTYQAIFQGSPGFTDTHPVTGFHVTGAPYDLQLNPR